MQTENAVRDSAIRSELIARKERLTTVLKEVPRTDRLVNLLQEVDAALERMNDGTFGICETCHDSIEHERLLVDPLIRNCLDHLTEAEQRALERDLDLAYQIQKGLLPKPDLAIEGWNIAYRYEPAGPVSGDHCDIITLPDEGGAFYFVVGDVSGKGVAASLLMAHLHAIFRSLASARLSPSEVMNKANRIFCEGTMTTHFATLVLGRAGTDGRVHVVNAGHPPPLVVRSSEVVSIPATGIPVGLFCDADYHATDIQLRPNDTMLIYTDGVSEAVNVHGKQYGADRLAFHLSGNHRLKPSDLIASLLEEMRAHRGKAHRTDDVTVMAIQRG
jgi:sigma-B regulation protein RsbU (phosphoserine phosphatase)